MRASFLEQFSWFSEKLFHGFVSHLLLSLLEGSWTLVSINYFPNNLQVYNIYYLKLQLPSSNDPTDELDNIKMKRFFPPYFNDEQEHNQDLYFWIWQDS